jgi:hypothetical protein
MTMRPSLDRSPSWFRATAPSAAAQDRRSVAAGQEHETAYEAQKTAASTEEVKRAVRKVGNSRAKVERELGR